MTTLTTSCSCRRCKEGPCCPPIAPGLLSWLTGWLDRWGEGVNQFPQLRPALGVPAETISSGGASVYWGYLENSLGVPYPQQTDAEQPLLPSSTATAASLYLRIKYDCNQERQGFR